MIKPIVAVWFSCGAASAVAAYLTAQKYGATHDIRILNNPVKEEHEDNLRFLKDVEAWIGLPIERVAHSKFPNASAVEIWDDQKGMVFPHGAPCTRYAKKFARQEWEKDNKAEWHVLGFTSEEEGRHDNFILTERDNVLPILIDAGLTKQDCYDFLLAHGIQPSVMYALGYPNANCIGCVKATSPTYWNHVRITFPEVFQARAEQSRRLGVRLVRYRGKRIFLDELPPDAVGRPMKEMNIECSSFCEETGLTPQPKPLLTFNKFNAQPRESRVQIDINLNINLTGPFAELLGKVLGADARPTRGANIHGIGPDTDGGPNQDYVDPTERQDPQPEAQRRTRRTKAQIEADEAAAKGIAQPADQGGTQESGTADPSTTGTTATNAASPSDLAAALEAAEPEARAGVTAKADVAAKMQEAMAATSPKKVQDRMAESLGGAKRLSEIDPANYASAIELFDDIIAGR